MIVLYLVKTSNDFYGIQYSIKYATPHFTATDLWLQNSPDLNPVDYKDWGIMQEHIYSGPMLDVADLKQCLTDAWSGLQQHVIDEEIDQRSERLCACVRIDGRHFEHLL